MKKIKYVILIISVIFLSGCDLLLNLLEDNNGVTFEIENDISIRKTDYNDFDFSTVIKIYKDGNEVSFSNAKVKAMTELKENEICFHEVTYKDGLKDYSTEFAVYILGNDYLINELPTVTNNTNVAVSGTINYIDLNGFIITDNTASIYINYTKNDFPVGSTVTVVGTFNNIDIFSIDAVSVKMNNNKKNNIIPNEITDVKLYEMIKNQNCFLAQFIAFDTTIITENNELYLLGYGPISSGFKVSINNNSIDDKINLIDYTNKLINVNGWLYGSDNFVVTDINYEIIENNGNSPVITVESNYFYYDDISDVKRKENYFTVNDKEDGKINVTSSMVSGNIITGTQNILTLKVTDSNGLTSTKSILIEVKDDIDYIKENIDIIDPNGMPSNGDVDVLVIPISFPNYKANSQMLEVIEKGFFGDSYDTGWESLKTYYQKSSYGKLNISGTVTNWYTPQKSKSYYASYEDDDDYIYGSTILMVEALTYFKDYYDYSDYDSNNDGYIDAVYLVYNVSIGGIGFGDEEDFYWAFTYWDIYAPYRNYDDTLGYSYVFMGYDFFLEEPSYSKTKLKINAETLIHETGHLMNLDDYYDYDEFDSNQNDGGYCGADMMDYNIGDHGPLSKLLLNWIEPTVVYKSGIYYLSPFTTTGSTLVIGANETFSTIFSEYYLIDYYTLDGLNSFEVPEFFKTTDKNIGVRISHVNASLTYDKQYYPTFTYDNTETKYKLIRLLEKDYKGKFDIENFFTEGATLSDFWRTGDVFGINYYSSYTSAKENVIPFTLKVLEMNNNYVKVEITFK